MPTFQKTNNIVVVICFTVIFLLFFACDLIQNKYLMIKAPPSERIDGSLQVLNPEGNILASITIEIEETSREQLRGLMYRTTLSPHHGMLFLFNKSDKRSFWMHNTYIPLDMLFIDARGVIVHLVKNAPPRSDKTILSKKPVKYVLEVNGGFAEKYHVRENCRIQWERRISESH